MGVLWGFRSAANLAVVYAHTCKAKECPKSKAIRKPILSFIANNTNIMFECHHRGFFLFQHSIQWIMVELFSALLPLPHAKR